jgi:hypothetical protein
MWISAIFLFLIFFGSVYCYSFSYTQAPTVPMVANGRQWPSTANERQWLPMAANGARPLLPAQIWKQNLKTIGGNVQMASLFMINAKHLVHLMPCHKSSNELCTQISEQNPCYCIMFLLVGKQQQKTPSSSENQPFPASNIKDVFLFTLLFVFLRGPAMILPNFFKGGFGNSYESFSF